MTRSALTPLAILTLTTLTAAQDPAAPDPVAAELAEAKATHRRATEAARGNLARAFGEAEKGIREDTVLRADQQVEFLKLTRQERDAFEKDGTLPASPRLRAAAAEYKAAVAAAARQLDRAYEKAIKAYTKLGQDARAEALLTEKKMIPGPADANPFEAGVTLEGHHVFMGRKYPAKLAILSRDKEAFRGRLTWLWNNEPEAALLVEGKITPREVTFRSTKVERGQGILVPVTYTGTVNGTVLSGTWLHRGSRGDAKGEFRYSPAPKPKETP